MQVPSYRPNVPVLQGVAISYSVKPGQMLALVGLSASVINDVIHLAKGNELRNVIMIIMNY